jgi:hypothetical protein
VKRYSTTTQQGENKNMTTRPNEKVIRETLSVYQLTGMLDDLKAFRVNVISKGLNMDIGIVDDDIRSMEQRVADKVNEGV